MPIVFAVSAQPVEGVIAIPEEISRRLAPRETPRAAVARSKPRSDGR